PQYEAVIIELLYKFLDNGAVYKGLRPVLWCIRDRTALAEAEIEYKDHTSPSVWVRYRLVSDPAQIEPRLAGKKGSTIILPTTPWTLPASLAVAFHPDEQYVAMEHAGEIYIVAEKLAPETAAKIAGGNAGGVADEGARGELNVLARFPGQKLEQTRFRHPFL